MKFTVIPGLRKFLNITILCLVSVYSKSQAPLNDSCKNAKEIIVSGGGFGTGIVKTDTFNISSATVEVSEYLHPDLVNANNNKKTIWFKFYLPIKRGVKIEMKQPGTKIGSKDAGFVTFKSDTCYPNAATITAAFITPLNQFGSSAHPCMEPGWYMIQIGSKGNGPIYLELTTTYPSQNGGVTNSKYDRPDSAYHFGTLVTGRNEKRLQFETGCYTLEDSNEYANCIGKDKKHYTQSSWHVFKTEGNIDLVEFLLVEKQVSPPITFFPGGTKVYANVYSGDVRNSGIKGIKKIDSCIVFDFDYRSFYSYWNRPVIQPFLCKFNPNQEYTLQLIFPEKLTQEVELHVRYVSADSATASPKPIKSMLTSRSNWGMLNSSSTGTFNYFTEYISCNSRFKNNPCGNANPAQGVTLNGVKYGASAWVTFETPGYVNLDFGYRVFHAFRLFNDTFKSSCSRVDTAKLVSKGSLWGAKLNCLPKGKYIMQILARDTIIYDDPYSNGLALTLPFAIKVTDAISNSKFNLSDSSRVDSINRFKPVDNFYYTQEDYFGCENTVLPGLSRCDTSFKKAIYRIFKIGDVDSDGKADSGLVSFHFDYGSGLNFQLFNKNLRSLAAKQLKFNYPDTIANSGLITECIFPKYWYNSRFYCLVPGEYTLVSLGGDQHSGTKDLQIMGFNKFISKYGNPDFPENLDTITKSKISEYDLFTCKNNIDSIDGRQVCNGSKKAVFREFYLPKSMHVAIGFEGYTLHHFMGLYQGRISNGIKTLKSYNDPDGKKWDCFYSQATNSCFPLPAGWYTIVNFGYGPSYNDPLPLDESSHSWQGSLSQSHRIKIDVLNYPQPRFNRPFKAFSIDDSLNGGKPLTYKVNRGTCTFPRYAKAFCGYVENFNCKPDTPLNSHPLQPCYQKLNHVAYYTFGIADESSLQVTLTANGNWAGDNAKVFIYAFDVRKDSSKMSTHVPLQSCAYNRIEICRIKPGRYTLVIMADSTVSNIQPCLYLDSVAVSRFDFAAKAYDFGEVKGDSLWNSGKIGDHHPTDTGRAASNDIISCTTGAGINDPLASNCTGSWFNPNVYPDTVNAVHYPNDSIQVSPYLSRNVRRNIWYTFTLKGSGFCKIKLNMYASRYVQNPHNQHAVFELYSSDESGNLDFDTLRKIGKIDSTLAQGLQKVVSTNEIACGQAISEVSFTKPLCDTSHKKRYYLLVSDLVWNYYWWNRVVNQFPYFNNQIDVEILYDSFPIPSNRYDHYSSANMINGLGQIDPPYTSGSLKSNTLYEGSKGFFVKATSDTADQIHKGICNNYGIKKPATIWYKFKVDSSGTVLFRLKRFFANYQYKTFDSYYSLGNSMEGTFVILKEVKIGDSTIAGLEKVNINPTYSSYNSENYASFCVTNGWYYINVSSCQFDNCSDFVVPELIYQHQKGDLCADAIQMNLSGLGTVSGKALVDCHTIGTDFGEDGSNMGCLYGPGGYKSTWYKIDYDDTVKADINFQMTEYTTAQPAEIRYRTYYGGCNALTSGPCNNNSQTTFTLNCMKKGAYFVQVVSPNSAKGEIEMHVTATKNLDTSCVPVNLWKPYANFIYSIQCPKNRVQFTNLSTKGDSIRYQWNFGNGISDTSYHASVQYPILNKDSVYRVVVKATNITRNERDSLVEWVTIPATPRVKLPMDTAICQNDTVVYRYTGIWKEFLWNSLKQNQYKAFKTGDIVLSVLQRVGNDSSCWVHDTAFLKVNSLPMIDLGNDTLLCPYDSIVKSVPSYFSAYSWSNGSIQNLAKLGMGTYHLTITDSNRCKAYDTILLSPTHVFDTIIRYAKPACASVNSIRLSAKPKFPGYYSGNHVDSNGIFYPNQAGAGSHRVFYQFADSFSCLFKDTAILQVHPQPLPGFSINDSTHCLSGNDFKFYNNSSIASGTLTYAWDFGDITTSSSASPSKSYSASGIYSVKLIAISNYGCKDSLSKAVSVFYQPQVTFSVNRDSQCLRGNRFQFTNGSSVTGSTLSFGWSLGNGFKSLAKDTSCSYASFGRYRVKLIAFSAQGCMDSMEKVISVYDQPKASFLVNDSNQCVSGNRFDFTNSSSVSGSNMTYLWKFGDGSTSSTSNPSKSYSAAGTYLVKLFVFTAQGCGDSSEVMVTVYHKPAVSFSINDSTQCLSGNNFIFTNNSSVSTGSLSYLWAFGDGKTSTSANPSNSYASAGGYLVKLIATSSYGCRDSLTKKDTVYHKPAVSFSINDSTQCVSGNNFVFSNSSSVTLGTLSYLWKFGDGKTSTSVNPSNSYASAGGYLVKMIATSNYGCRDSLTKKDTVYYKPSVNFSINDSTQCVSGNNFIFTNNSSVSAGSLSYLWKFGDGRTSTSANPSNSYASAGGYLVKLIATSNYGCRDSLTKKDTVYYKPAVSFSINDSTQCVSGNNFIFTNNSSVSSGSLSYLWAFGDGKTSTSANPSNSYASAGGYLVKLIATSNYGCRDSLTKKDTVYYKPAVSFSINDSTQCVSGNNFIFTNNSSVSAGSLSYLWAFGDGKTSTSANPSNAYASSGGYLVKLIATSNYGCRDSSTVPSTVFYQPQMAFAVNQDSQCLRGNRFDFTNSSSVTGSKLSYRWMLGNGLRSTSKDTSCSYFPAGRYRVKLIALSAQGCEDSLEKGLFVYDQPKASFAISDTNQCVGGNRFDFTNTSSVTGSTMTYLWKFGDDSTSIYVNPTKSYASAGTYSVKLIAQSAQGCRDSSEVMITVYYKPSVSFGIDNDAQCLSGNRFNFTNSSSVTGSSLSYKWETGDKKWFNTQHLSYSYDTAKTYTIILVAASVYGCRDSVSKPITVHPQPKVDFSINNSNQCLSGNHFVFTNGSSISSGTLGYLWDFGDTSTSSATNPVHSYDSAGGLIVKLHATSDYRCKDSLVKPVKVYHQPKVSFTINNDSQCLRNHQFFFTNTSTVVGSNLSYLWKFGDGDTASSKDTRHRYVAAGTYPVMLRALSGQTCRDSIYDTVVIHHQPKSAFTVDPDTQCLNGNRFDFKNNSTVNGAILRYEWLMGDGSSSQAINPQHSYPDSGKKNVRLNAISEFNCRDTAYAFVVVDTMPQMKFNPVGVICYKDTARMLTTNNNLTLRFYGGTFISSTGNFSPQNAKIGLNRVFVEGRDSRGCQVTDSLDIQVIANPDAGIIAQPPLCIDTGTVVLKAKVAGGWFSGNYISSAGAFNSRLAGAGSHKVYHNLTIGECSSLDSTSVIVHPLPMPDFRVSPVSGCEPLAVRFVSRSADACVWRSNISFLSSQDSFDRTFAKGTYQINLLLKNQFGCDTVVNDAFDVFPRPVASFVYSPQEIFAGLTTVRFINTTQSTYIRSEWSVGSVIFSTAKDAQSIFPDTGKFNIQLIIENQHGCMDTATGDLTVIDEFRMFLPNSFSPNNDGINDLFEPAGTGIIHYKLVIYNRWGEKLHDANTPWDGKYKGATVQDGSYLYFLKVKDNRGITRNTFGNVMVLR